MINFFSKKTKDLPKVKIIAVAKDEAAYIPQWVHHHLEMGFDEIHVLVNRTTDNSFAILEKINKCYPQVSYESLDWVDKCSDEVKSKIQEVGYAQALNTEIVRDEVDYLMFLDIDEFWMPKSLNVSIGEKIQSLNYPDAISFQWINELATDDPFEFLSESIDGKIHSLSKTVFKLKADVKAIRLHVPELSNKKKMVLSDGKPFKSIEGKPEQIDTDLSYVRDVMVIHRMFRSPLEYISLLNRGRPSTTDFNLKTNRGGFNNCLGELVKYHLNSENFAAHRDKYSAFIDETGLEALICQAEEFVTKRYQSSLQTVQNAPDKYACDVVKVLRNTTGEIIKVLNKRFGSDSFINSISRPKVLVDIALEYQHVDTVIAERYVDRALTLHPDGPKLKAMKNRLNQLNSSK